jgi:hypothetical protein
MVLSIYKCNKLLNRPVFTSTLNRDLPARLRRVGAGYDGEAALRVDQKPQASDIPHD